jgi:hypothetical protein
MATYIFGEKKLEHPFFVSFDIGFKNFSVAEGISEKPDQKGWVINTLKTICEGREAKEILKTGLVVHSGEKEILVKIKKVFIIEKIQLFIDGNEIKGNQYIEFKLGTC